MPRRSSESLRDAYLEWLESQMRDGNDRPDKTFRDLAAMMFATEFFPTVPMDDNRVHDGKDLRTEFANAVSRSARKQREAADYLMQMAPISFLEVLIGLSRTMAFVAGGEAPGWCWQLLTNLELHRMPDPLTSAKRRKVDDTMHAVIERTYSPDGMGGFFPLAWPDGDQTKIELWYQLNAYVEELHPEH